MIEKEPKYISLKEAAQISGYSADYVGQLIRSGKIPGKQVFLNVAWMTTEEAVTAYLNKNTKSAVHEESFLARLLESVFSLQGLSHIYTYALWGAIGFLTAVLIFLAYVFAVSVDNAIETRYLEKVQYER